MRSLTMRSVGHPHGSPSKENLHENSTNSICTTLRCGAACIIECYVKMTKGGGGCGRVESRKSACDRENCRFEIDLLLIPFVNFLSLSLIHSSSFTADGVFSSRSASSTGSTSSPASYSTSRRYPGSSTPAASSRNLSSVSERRFT